MEKIYNPQGIKQPLYEHWEKQGYFKSNGDEGQESFYVMILPPNVTSGLHMGHAFQQAITDAMIRCQRTQGKDTLWQVGADHARIATQMAVGRRIAAEEDKTRHSYGHEALIDKIWEWGAESGGTITRQVRHLGNSADWEHERLIVDEGLFNAVKEAFVRLYKEDLVYRGKRLVNWDPKLRTVISDLEVENRGSKGSMWYIRYPLVDGAKTANGKNYLVVAVTRPETLLGDTGVTVNPEGPRYKNLVDKYVIPPLVNRHIPITGDEYADMGRGTSCMKITSAHDFNNYGVGKCHVLPTINILISGGDIRESTQVLDTKGNEPDVYSSEIPAELQKPECFATRKAVVAAVDAPGLLEEIKSHDLTILYGGRGGVVIEPMLTDQWYVCTDVLAKPATETVENGDIQLVPKQYENMYLSWMCDIQDWCISRQLWWGHCIPAWYSEAGSVYVGHNEDEVHRGDNLGADVTLRQDEDVLDTRLSYTLWTLSMLGWLKNTDTLHQLHPTSVMVSSLGIIFFWIARMIMMTIHPIKDENGKPQVPFHTVYTTGLIRDDEDQKISRSKDNVIDSLGMVGSTSLPELLEKRTGNTVQPRLADKVRKRTKEQFPNGIKPHGTDALRFTLVTLASTGHDINWDMERLEDYHNLCNKLRNTSRFVLMNVEGQDCDFNGGEMTLSLTDRWILAEFNQTIKAYRETLGSFRLDIAAGTLYEFTWNQFCDQYLELIRPVMNDETEAELRGIRHTLAAVLKGLLRLTHPIIPFITETVWQRVKVLCGITADAIMLQPFPQYDASQVDEAALAGTERLKQAITAVRNIRAEMNIASGKPLELLLCGCSADAERRVSEDRSFLQTLVRLESIIVLSADDKGPVSITKIVDGAELLIPMVGLISKKDELVCLAKEAVEIEGEISRIENKLTNGGFVARAPEVVIAKERERLEGCAKAKAKLIGQQAVIAAL